MVPGGYIPPVLAVCSSPGTAICTVNGGRDSAMATSAYPPAATRSWLTNWVSRRGNAIMPAWECAANPSGADTPVNAGRQHAGNSSGVALGLRITVGDHTLRWITSVCADDPLRTDTRLEAFTGIVLPV